MKRKLRVTIVAAIAAQLIAILAYGGVVVASSHNDIQDHKNGAGVCINCHGGVSEDVSYKLDPKNLNSRTVKMRTAHGRHTKSSLLNLDSTNCTACHKSTNKTEYLNANDLARKTVDPALCSRCHGAPVTNADPDMSVTRLNGRVVGHESVDTMKRGSCRTGVCHGGSGKAASAALKTLHADAITSGHSLSGVVDTSKTHILCRRCHGGIKLFSATEIN